jgi:uncharacterized protein (DUF1800 family)
MSKKHAAIFTITTLAALALCAWAGAVNEKPSAGHLPWKEAGLTEREAAAHLLNRFAYGPRPGDVDAVVRMGLERWFERQLAADIPEGPLEQDLRRLPALRMSTAEILETYPPAGIVLAEALQAGVIPQGTGRKDLKDEDREELRDKVYDFARERGYRAQKELLGQLMTAKLARAVESNNQLAEVVTDFWFNHFNVSLTDNQTRSYLLPYERDAIRPNALGRFRDLLEATAKSPAMLLYLDNAQSSAAAEATTTLERRMRRNPPEIVGRMRPKGLNENYARELLELHTLGVDGGYTQKDVVEVARAFTGWSVMPPGRMREMTESRLARTRRVGGLGFHREGEFLFRADQHDAGANTVLGAQLPAGRGMEDGEAVLDLLAKNPATARHLAAKLAVRFVSDAPPKVLVDRLADIYLKTGSDVRRMLAAIAESPEFWSRQAIGAKVKSPFELTASALRATGGEVEDPREILKWIGRMGQPLYAYQAPTGYPDRAEAWVNNGSLLNRMSFGLQLAAGRVRGIEMDLPDLNGGREPESREEALKVYAGLLMPGRDLAPALKLLGPMVADPDLVRKIDEAAPGEEASKLEDRRPPTAVEQVVGVILGSPEFQRR